MNRTQMLAALAAESWSILPRAFNAIVAGLPDQIEGSLLGRLEAAQRSTRPKTTGSVAIVPVHGVITKHDSIFTMLFGGTSTDSLGMTIRELAADESVGSILLDVDSPGGTISGLPELAAIIRAAREVKPVVALTNDVNASAAYWISSQANEVVSVPEGITGSIGVFTTHVDISEALAQEGVKVTLISAGKFKTEGNEFEPLGDDAQKAIQALVDDGYDLFVADVAKGRGVAPKAIRDGYGQGRALSSADAKTAGLIDRVATMSEVLGRAAQGQLAGRRTAEAIRDKDLSVRVVVGEMPVPDPTPPTPPPTPDPEPQVDVFAFEREFRKRRGLITTAPDSAGAFLGR